MLDVESDCLVEFMNYLLKTEPTVYSFADLQRENTTIWDGVTNPVALKNLRSMKPGERRRSLHRSRHARWHGASGKAISERAA